MACRIRTDHQIPDTNEQVAKPRISKPLWGGQPLDKGASDSPVGYVHSVEMGAAAMRSASL